MKQLIIYDDGAYRKRAIVIGGCIEIKEEVFGEGRWYESSIKVIDKQEVNAIAVLKDLYLKENNDSCW